MQGRHGLIHSLNSYEIRVIFFQNLYAIDFGRSIKGKKLKNLKKH